MWINILRENILFMKQEQKANKKETFREKEEKSSWKLI